MKILYLADKIPFPVYSDGGTLMNYHVMTSLKTEHELDFITFESSLSEVKKEFMDSICDNLILVKNDVTLRTSDYLMTIWTFRPPFHNKKSENFLNELTQLVSSKEYDLIFVDGIFMDIYARGIVHPNKVISLHDSLSLLYWTFSKNSPRIILKLYYYFCSKVYEKTELEIVTNYRKCLFVSKKDIEFLQKRVLARFSNCLAIQNGVNRDLIKYKESKPKNSNAIVFTGVMDYKPNVEAVLYFVREIFPLVLNKNPQTIFYVVGKNPTDQIKLLARKNIRVTGFVEDISSYISRCCVYVSPLLSGAGLKNKVLEAMALRIPIVSTSISLDGINVEDEKHILARDSPTGFAESVSRLLYNEKLREQLASNSYELILKEYTWEHVYGLYQEAIES